MRLIWWLSFLKYILYIYYLEFSYISTWIFSLPGIVIRWIFFHSNKIYFKKYILGRIIAAIILSIPLHILIFGLSIYYNGLTLPVISALFYNLGYSAFALTLFAIFSIKKIDVNQTIFMNRQGENLLHYLSIFVMFIPPLLVLLLLQNYIQIAYIVNGLIGLLGILLSDKWLDLIYKQFQYRKYQILEELR